MPLRPHTPHPVPSQGERALQAHMGTSERADDFYDRQVQPRLTPAMSEFIARQTMVFLSTADTRGHCDASFRAGPPGFVTVLDDLHLAYPEYRGNGVMASAGNITENPHMGLLFIDFTHDHIGLHVNGSAQLVSDRELRAICPTLPSDSAPGRQAEMWIHLTVQEAYVHCSKHIPHLEPAHQPNRRAPGRPKDGDYFTEQMSHAYLGQR
ncbi:pyridoxamine 5'-phosphate oxidase family protein [Streptomyces sp. NPDC058293]|uniref:Pyridoxamine 5'-phosphate oxidase family protein n=1 Tax=Streptomyces sp. NBC_00119 TaxID=2975659 RepID=A0AAU1UHP9_9ACTN|nr:MULTISPECIES: pyridoxamine 5'-phosphate oxidase family protein [unclassified Streptomyces]MCX4647887.1 pyridoxamine 5'-phosphate oxidase family protein [Streptomyces sp. NBC_01446]MCX5320465.1 pyridoxamine 5'-phosphate oxidase family protein [Streptomyces sp. NBC_00120]